MKMVNSQNLEEQEYLEIMHKIVEYQMKYLDIIY